MCGRIVGIQFNRASKFTVRLREIEVVGEQRLRKRGMCFTQSAVQLQRLLRGRFGLRQTILRTSSSETREQDVGVRQPGIGERITRIFRGRLIEVVDRFAQVYGGSFVPKKSAF